MLADFRLRCVIVMQVTVHLVLFGGTMELRFEIMCIGCGRS